MRVILLVCLLFISNNIFAYNCDCEIHAFHPLSSSTLIKSKILKKFEVESFGRFSKKNIESCRKLCTDEFEEKISSKKLNRMLLEYTSQLINEGIVGYSCSSLTQFKYPIRIKAYLGSESVGVSSDFIQIIHFDQKCF